MLIVGPAGSGETYRPNRIAPSADATRVAHWPSVRPPGRSGILEVLVGLLAAWWRVEGAPRLRFAAHRMSARA